MLSVLQYYGDCAGDWRGEVFYRRMYGTKRHPSPQSISIPQLVILSSRITNLVSKKTASFNIQSSIMATQTESQIKHHPDDWSLTSTHHHHVERTVHPVLVELIKWACSSNIPLYFLHSGG